jgi:hypothetical protein
MDLTLSHLLDLDWTDHGSGELSLLDALRSLLSLFSAFSLSNHALNHVRWKPFKFHILE